MDQFPFLQPPIYKFIQDGYQLLNELGAVDSENKILPLGRQLAKMPLDPSLGRILIESKKQNCVKRGFSDYKCFEYFRSKGETIR